MFVAIDQQDLPLVVRRVGKMDWTPNGTPPPLPLSQDPAAKLVLVLGLFVAVFIAVVFGLLLYNIWH